MLSPVVAIVLPAEHEEFYVGDDPADDHWQVSGMPVVLSFVEYLSEPLAASLRHRAPHYRVDFSQTTGHSYWMNHCEHCAAKLGDFATACGGYTYIEWFADARHQKSSRLPLAL